MLTRNLTLREAARKLNVSLSTLRRRIMDGSVPAVRSPGPYGERWEIEPQVIASLRFNSTEVHEAGMKPVGAGEAGPHEPPAAGWSASRSDGEAVGALQSNVHEAAWTGSNGAGEVGRGAGNTFVPMKVYQHLLEELRITERSLGRAERENDGLREVLSKHRLVLEENARSLVEREARVREAEAVAAEAQTALQKAELEATARQKAEQQLQAMQHHVQLLESQAAKRKLPWYRRIFRGQPREGGSLTPEPSS